MNAISTSIDPAVSWRSNVDILKTQLSDYLDKFCLCSCNDKLLTSILVMQNELDPTNPRSTINRKSVFFRQLRQTNYGTAPNYAVRSILDVLTTHITPVPVTVQEISSVTNAIGQNNGLSLEDLSLIVCSAKQPSLVGVISVTSDTKLEKALDKIMTQGTLVLPSGTFSTGRILPVNNYSYISFLHKCCEISNEKSLCIFSYIAQKDFERSHEMGEEVAKAKGAAIVKSLEVRDKIVEYKLKKLSGKT